MKGAFGIGMIGCGTVGTGVLELLHRRRPELAQRLGLPLKVVRIAVRDPERPRHHAYAYVDPDVFTAEVTSVTRNPDVDVVVEVAGGADLPRDWIVDALRHGKDVVTANKATLAHHGAEIFGVARDCQRSVYYEASVAAALPIIEILQNGLVGNRVTSFYAILNGTCNYILTRMEFARLTYEGALAEAQQKGFAEADPSIDVSGVDAAHKLALLARIVTHSYIPVDRIFTEGIQGISNDDVAFAEQLDYCIRLLAIVHRTEEGAWDLRVHPTLVHRDQLIARVMNESNAVFLDADAAGPLMVYGQGAGSLPTASSVVADVVRVARGDRPTMNCHAEDTVSLVPVANVRLRNYIRMTVLDMPGVLGRITSFLGMKGISISSLHQPEAKHGQPVPVVLVTHRTADQVVTDAFAELQRVGLLLGTPTRIRIEEGLDRPR